MRALDDLGSAIVTANALDERIVWLARVFRDEDVTGPAQIPRRFAQGAARQQQFVAERRLSIDQNHVEPMFEMQILQPIIE